MEIAVEQIHVQSNPRTDFGNIDELRGSIREKGIIEPLVVKEVKGGKYELIAGERRLRAAMAAGLDKVPVAVRQGDEADIEEVKLIENIHRKDFNPIEEGLGFLAYMDKTGASIWELDTFSSYNAMLILMLFTSYEAHLDLPLYLSFDSRYDTRRNPGLHFTSLRCFEYGYNDWDFTGGCWMHVPCTSVRE